MKKKKKKLNIKRVIFLIIIVILIFCLKNFLKRKNIVENNSFLDLLHNSEYKVIKQDSNPKYSGIGQEIVQDKDGYFTTFTTTSENQKTYKEYKQNGTSSWANKKYWGGTMAEKGCGITAISIILSGYNKDYTPNDLREKYYPILNSEKISSTLSKTFKIKNSDFYYDNTHLSKNSLEEHLETNRPILICVWNKPKSNRWTTESHYMVLLASDNNGKVYISNPNGLANTEKSSGWYDFDEVTPFIAKALYIENYK